MEIGNDTQPDNFHGRQNCLSGGGLLPCRALLTLVMLPALGFWAGCGEHSSTSTPLSTSPTGASLAGRVMGGLTPIKGATVDIYAAGTGYGAGAMLLETATTNSNGEFSLSFPCSPVNKNIYMTSTGGNAGAGTNTAIGLMAVVGDCTSASFPASVVINELTTVAAIWPTAQFNSTSGTPYAATLGGPATGFDNALATAAYLIDPSTGQPPNTPPAALAGTGAIPMTKINTLADILANCVQSSGPTSTPCASLFTNADLPAKPKTTLEAALNMALNPTQNVSVLYGLAAGGPFTGLSAAPTTLALTLTWTGGGLTSPYGVAVDASGNVWATNAGLPSTAPGTTVSELSPPSATWLSGSSGYGATAALSGPEGLAIDSKGNVWVANTCPGCTTSPTNLVTELSSKGVATKSFSTNLSGPLGIAVDLSGNIWVANTMVSTGNYILSENAKGTATEFTAVTYAGFDQPSGIAIDSSGNPWLTDALGSAVTEDQLIAGQFVNYSAGSAPLGIESDPYGYVWAVSGGSLSEYNTSGFNITPSSIVAADFSGPQWLAIDSAGDLWVTNNTENSVTEVVRGGTASSPTFTPLTPITSTASPMNGPMGIAIDPSGNVWIANNGAATGALTELLGVAAPVLTPVIGVPGKPTEVNGGSQN